MQKHFITNESGTRLCLHQLEATGKCVGTVVLAHGMFSNYRVCRGLAKYLTSLSFECWLVDFQGHGASDKPQVEPDFESMSLQDTAAILAFMKQHQSGPLWWVGHSGGGLSILMYLSRHADRQSDLAGIVTIASQATDAGYSFTRRSLLKLSSVVISLLGVAPGRLLGLGPENEFARVMLQWIDWSLAGSWTGKDRFDYLQQLSTVNLPILSLAAHADKFIAPVSGCNRIYRRVGSADKTFIVFGKKNGYLEDYTHARVVSSRNASVDVWPVIAQWLVQR